MIRWAVVCVILGGCAATNPAPLDWHVLVSEVGSATARLQVFGDEESTLQLDRGEAFREGVGAWRLRSLPTGGDVKYTVCGNGSCIEGSFRTAPEPDDSTAVRFAFGGDVAGQNVCRDLATGVPMFAVMRAANPDFFIALGDMVYADNDCEPVGRYGNDQHPLVLGGGAQNRSEFDQRWNYVRSDAAFQALLRQTGYYGVWDDHEVINDFYPDSAGEAYAPGKAAFRSWSGLSRDPLHRSTRWGRHAEVFILDTRSFRSPNSLEDGFGKTLLGAEQRDWLVSELKGSDATWKFVVSSVPIAIPTGWPPEGPRDGWASGASETGYEHELLSILDDVGCTSGLIWLSTDVHFATAFLLKAPSGWAFHELVTGPMHAGLFPSRVIDETFHPERLHFHGPSGVDAVQDYAEALRWFNAGLVEIDDSGSLRYQVVTAQGETAFDLALPPPESCHSR